MIEKQFMKYLWLPALMFFIVSAIPIRGHAEMVNYELIIAQEKISIADKTAEGMTINGGIPGPVLRFTEGDTARIHVQNQMSVPTSIHWHGLLVPPGMDGVPYISFPPIQPGKTFTYAFPIRQSGTYWYHSHSNLQEQSGVYGSIVIEPEMGQQQVDSDHVILFSDWTAEDPHKVLRTLKRGSEWYAIEKGSSQSILGAARIDMLGSYFNRELQRMPAMDIADVAYDYFLANGQPETDINTTSDSLVRLRIINGSATTYFHLEFAGGPMTIISADGLEVQAVDQQRFLIAVAETYDVLVKVPPSGAHELRATAHDASGYASVWIGNGQRFSAPDVPKPNLYQGMMHGSPSSIWALTPAGAMGMSDDMVNSGKFDQPGMMGMQGMSMEQGHVMDHSQHMAPGNSNMQMENSPSSEGDTESLAEMTETLDMMTMQDMPMDQDQDMDHGQEMAPGSPDMNMQNAPTHENNNQPMAEMTMGVPESVRPIDPEMQKETPGGKKYARNFRPFVSDVSSIKDLAADGMDPRRPWSPYPKLRALKPTAIDTGKPVRDIRLTLDGDMERYVWLLNNKTLSESDVIRIRAGEVVRFIMINRTMMHHPMHLHGHFFRVLNGQGDHAPLKHTVNVAPMSTTVIEFAANEFGDWFFHCHLLYHMKSGMARVIHYDGYQPDPEVTSVRSKLFKDPWYAWGEADVLSNMTEGGLTLSNTRSIIQAQWEAGWQNVDETDWEGLLTYDRYLNRFGSIFAGADLLGQEDTTEESRGVIGFRYLIPLNFESLVWVDTDGGARVMLEKEFVLTPRIALLGEIQYDTHDLWEGATKLSYILTRTISLLGLWNSEYGWGGGVQVRF